MDRTMIVIKFFIDKSDVIGSEMKKLFKSSDSTFIEVATNFIVCINVLAL